MAPNAATDAPAGDEPLDVDRLMREIRADIAARLPATSTSSASDQVDETPRRDALALFPRVARIGEFARPIERKTRYRLDDFLAYHDEDFVRNAYVALLGREPDPEGASRYLARIRAGELSRVDVLARIRYSPEGKAAGARIEGLLLPFAVRTLRRAPLLGRLVGIVQYLWRLPDIARNHEILESALFATRNDLRARVNAVVDDVEEVLSRLKEVAAGQASRLDEADDEAIRLGRRFDAVAGDLRRKADQSVVDEGNAALRQELATTRQELATTRQELATKAQAAMVERVASELSASVAAAHDEVRAALSASVAAVRDEIHAGIEKAMRDIAALRDASQELGQSLARLAPAADLPALVNSIERAHRDVQRVARALDGAASGAPYGKSGPVSVATGEPAEAAFPEGFYVAFEDRFRGTRDDIRARVEVYLPYVVAARAGSPDAPVLDVGCGRGEWIELLRDEGLVAAGVDMNEVAVAGCRARGLDVLHADAVAHLRSLPDASLGALSALHVIEHLPLPRIVELFDEARRVLRPGGIVIFETPNPENLVVGACNFYYDPTHLRPLPPEPWRFVLAARGFERVEILRLHPDARGAEHDGVHEGWARALTERLYGPQDYALVGYR